MLKTIFKQSIRNLKSQKGYVFINIFGLSVGIACGIIIALYIIHELSYDQFNEKKDRLYTLNFHSLIGDREFNVAGVFGAFGPAMRKEIPEVEDFNRIRVNPEVTLKYGDKKIVVTDMIESDASFFNMFSIPVLRGDKNKTLQAPHTLVLSESTAGKIFGNEEPIGKTLIIGNDKTPFRITGIMTDIPEASHFNANIIASFTSSYDDWRNGSFLTYILLKPNTKPETVNAKIRELVFKYRGESRAEDKFYLESLNDIHFDQSFKAFANKPSGNMRYLFIFGSIALLIILIAAINFMNLSTAQASKRAKEVGIKKVSGSTKGMLILQFLVESVLLSFLSLILAVIIVENSLPFFKNLLGVDLQMNLFSNWFTIPTLLILSVIIGLLAGSYPAFFLSSFSPYLVLKGRFGNGMKSGRLKSILVTIQFSISIILIVGTIVMVRQIRFMLNKDLGFNKEHLLVITRPKDSIANDIKPFKEAVTKIPGIIKVASSAGVPGHTGTTLITEVSGEPGKPVILGMTDVDDDFFDAYGIKLSSGRFFNESMVTDGEACIVNECAVKKAGLINPLATRFLPGNFVIVGVVKDFHFDALSNEISPYMFKFNRERTKWRYINWQYLSVRLSPTATASTIKEIGKVWKEVTSDAPFQYFFMDQDFAMKYKKEKNNAQLSIIFSILAIIVASLGLFGLTAFALEQRTKEIGVRKITGSSVSGIFYLLSKEFIQIVFVSALIAWPLIYYVANKWLQNYYYRITLQPLDFLAGFIIIMVIALLTISYQTIKSARINPVDALRYE